MFIHENIPLAPLTTLQVGGPARFFFEAETEEDVCAAVDFSRSRKLPLFVLGGGSNLVISDTGWPGLVLKIGIAGIQIHSQSHQVNFEVGAGEAWDSLVALAVSQNCAGVECLSGIPGSVGGTPVQNVGAYGQEVSQTIQSVRVLNIDTREILELSKMDCGFSYRASIFNTNEHGRYIILKVTYALTPNGAPKVEYADLKKYFSQSGESLTLSTTREAVRRIRAGKGMLIIPGDPDSRSAGSFFKNPIVSPAQHEELTKLAVAKDMQLPSYPALDAQHKISAAWLVEHSGFPKGFRSGQAGISSKHSLALINKGNASAADILQLKEQIQQKVNELWNISLEPEPVLVGF